MKTKIKQLIKAIDKLPVCHCSENCKERHYQLIQYASVMTLITQIFDDELSKQMTQND